jgi:hypothetical protein
MNGAQKELMRSQANLNNAMAERVRNGSGQCSNATQGMFGNQCPPCQRCGRIGQQGMNGCGHGGAGPMQQIMGGFGQLMDMGAGYGNGFGGGYGHGGGWGGGFPGGCCGNQNGINLNFNF